MRASMRAVFDGGVAGSDSVEKLRSSLTIDLRRMESVVQTSLADLRSSIETAEAERPESRANVSKLQTDLERARSELNQLRHGWVPGYQALSKLDEVVQCEFCGAARGSLYSFAYPSAELHFAGLSTIGCAECGGSWVLPDSLDLDEYYSSAYSSENRRDRREAPREYFAEKNTKYEFYFERARRQVGYVGVLGRPVSSALDLGSGPGYFLHELTEAHGDGIRLLAVEPDQASQKYLDHLGASLIPQPEIGAGLDLDVVLSSHSLEHHWVDRLPVLLESVRDSLVDDGIFIFEVPTGHLTRYTINKRHDPHTIFFSPESIARSIERAGFMSLRMFPLGRSKATVRPDAIHVPQRWVGFEGTFGIVGVASKIEHDTRLDALAGEDEHYR